MLRLKTTSSIPLRPVGNQSTSCRARGFKEAGECCLHPSHSAVHSYTYPPIHPQIPSLLRPAYDAMLFVFGKAGAWVLRLGLRNTTSRTQTASRSSGVFLG